MPLIDLGQEFSDTKEAKVANEGQYDLRIEDIAETKEYAKWHYQLRVRITGVDDADDLAPIFHYLTVPTDKDREEQASSDDEIAKKARERIRMKMLSAKRLFAAFNVPVQATGFDPMDLLGASSRLPVLKEIPEDGPYAGIPQNRLKLPQMAEEGLTAQPAAAPTGRARRG